MWTRTARTRAHLGDLCFAMFWNRTMHWLIRILSTFYNSGQLNNPVSPIGLYLVHAPSLCYYRQCATNGRASRNSYVILMARPFPLVAFGKPLVACLTNQDDESQFSNVAHVCVPAFRLIDGRRYEVPGRQESAGPTRQI
jgi:hypothetical protein